MVSIWYRYEDGKPEKIDEAPTLVEAGRLAYEYKLAFGALERQHNHGKIKVWCGKKKDEPEGY